MIFRTKANQLLDFFFSFLLVGEKDGRRTVEGKENPGAFPEREHDEKKEETKKREEIKSGAVLRLLLLLLLLLCVCV